MTARVGLAMIALQIGDGEAAKEQYEALRPAKGLLIHTATDRLLAARPRNTVGRVFGGMMGPVQ